MVSSSLESWFPQLESDRALRRDRANPRSQFSTLFKYSLGAETDANAKHW